MRYDSMSASAKRRPGVVLLIVMALLAIFASLALTFVFYADAEALASQLTMEQLVRSQADIDPEALAAFVLRDLIYPTENMSSSVRGWELARGIYGYNPAALNYTPYNSPGRATALSYADPDFGIDNKSMVNYTYYYNPAGLAADRSQNFARTPEFFGKVFLGPNTVPPPTSYTIPPKLKPAQYRFVGGANPPWTAYDTNNLMLAQVAADGTVLMPSGVRPWNYYALPGSSQSAFRYTSLRPEPSWCFDPFNAANNTTLPDPRYPPGAAPPLVTTFLPPDSEFLIGGPDVKNLDFGPGMKRAVPIMPAIAGGVTQVGTTVVVNTAVPHFYSPGQSVQIWGVADGLGNPLPIYTGSFTVAGVAGPNSFTFTLPAGQPPGGGGYVWAPGSYYNNDSQWMYMGYPVLTAPNGKKYTMLVAPLIMDISNRVHLGVHGNGLAGKVLGSTVSGFSHASDMGYGPSEVNPLQLLTPIPIVPFPTPPKMPAGVVDAGGTVTVNTMAPHGFNVGDYVIVAGVSNLGYDGAFTVSQVVSPTSFRYAGAPGKLGISGNGVVYSGEFNRLLDRRYGGIFYGTKAAWSLMPQRSYPNWIYGGLPKKGVSTTSLPMGNAVNFTNPFAANAAGPWYSPTDLDGANPGIVGSTAVSSQPPIAGFTTTSSVAVGGGKQTMTLNSLVYPLSPPNPPVYAPITPGMSLVVGTGNPLLTEVVQVIAADNILHNFTATFTKAHKANTPVATIGFTTSTSSLSPKLLGTPQAMAVNAFSPSPNTSTILLANNAAIQPGMTVIVKSPGLPGEIVQVQDVNAPLSRFTATFTLPHVAGSVVTFMPNSTFPNFVTTGWANGGGGTEITNVPLGYNPYAPTAPNYRPIPSDLEAIFRFGGTNGPATLSEIFRIMPNTMRNPMTRNRVTMASNHLDRITAAPVHNFNRTTPGHYVLRSGIFPGTTFPNGIFPPTAGMVITSVVTKGALVTVTTQEQHNFPAKPAPLQTAVRFMDALGNVTPPPQLPPITITSVPSPFTFTYSKAAYPYPPPVVPAPPLLAPIVIPAPNYAGVNPLIANTSVAMTTAPWNSDYGPDWRSNLGNLLKVNLARPLTDFPTPAIVNKTDDATVGMIRVDLAPVAATYLQAVLDRQQLARDIYSALVRVTGAQDPNVVYPLGTAKAPLPLGQNPLDYQACRFLGQLAANIVDYIDDDDYNTAFQWYQPTAGTGEWVFGTELPRVVLNEAYAQQEPTSPGPANVYVWAEMLNTFNSSAAGSYPRDLGQGVLHNLTTPASYATGWPVCQLAICNQAISVNGTPVSTTAAMADAPNSLGMPPTLVKIQFDKATAKGNFTLAYNSGSKTTVVGTFAFNPPGTLVTRINAKLKPAAGIGPVDGINGVDYTDATPAFLVSPGTPPGADIGILYFTGGNGQFIVAASKLVDAKKKAVAAPTITPVTPGPVLSNQTTWNASPITMKVQPSNGATFGIAGLNNGYYLVGPTGSPTGLHAPNFPAATNSQGSMLISPPTASTPNGSLTLLLRKLANQHLPPQLDPTLPLYNPYVTVDYVDGLPVIQAGATTNSISGKQAMGRLQPYTAASTNYIGQGSGVAIWPNLGAKPPKGLTSGVVAGVTVGGMTPMTVETVAPHGFAVGDKVWINTVFAGLTFPKIVTVTGTTATTFTYNETGAVKGTGGTGYVVKGVQNSFYGQNNKVTGLAFTSPATPHTWLTHLDRPPVNPLELLFVSGYRPHLLTQNYLTPNTHYAPWNPLFPTPIRQQSLIYRALDVLGTPPHVNGTALGGRVPGNVNINTIVDKNVFRAVADPRDAAPLGISAPTDAHPYPLFTTAHVDTAYSNLAVMRHGGLGSDTLTPASDGKPFQGLAAGNIEDTVLRLQGGVFNVNPLTSPAALFSPSTNPSYVQNSLLQKIYNNISTTSNVFAIWCTVGFFEVVDDSVRPPRLGQEIGRTQNRHIRHRFFAVVDRSGMQLFPTVASNTAVAAPGTATITLAPTTPLPAQIGNVVGPTFQPGMLLEIDSGTPNAEVVAVMPAPVPTAASFTAIFTKLHGVGAPIICRGNPGPQLNYSPRRDPNVVLHLSVIK